MDDVGGEDFAREESTSICRASGGEGYNLSFLHIMRAAEPTLASFKSLESL